MLGKLSYQRMCLIPSTPTDADKLKEQGITGRIYPLDDVLGISRLPFKITVAAMLKIAKAAIRSESYEEAEKTLKEDTEIFVNDDTIRQVTNFIGNIIYNNDLAKANETWDQLNSGNLVLPDRNNKHTLYIEVDGAMLPTRQPKVEGVIYKENKLGIAFSTDNIFFWTDKHGKIQHTICKREYTSLLGNSEDFTKFMLALALRNGYGRYKDVVLISDGATWIRNMKKLIFPDAQQILDYYHLKEHFVDYIKSVFENNEKASLKYIAIVKELILNSKVEKAIIIFKKISNIKNKAKLDSLIQYLDNNKDNIDYAEYKKRGYFIGSGAIESGNKLFQRRLKIGPMRWNEDSCQSLISLIAKYRSGLWEADVVKPIYNYFSEPLPAKQGNRH